MLARFLNLSLEYPVAPLTNVSGALEAIKTVACFCLIWKCARIAGDHYKTGLQAPWQQHFLGTKLRKRFSLWLRDMQDTLPKTGIPRSWMQC